MSSCSSMCSSFLLSSSTAPFLTGNLSGARSVLKTTNSCVLGPWFVTANVTPPDVVDDWSSAIAKSFSVALTVAPDMLVDSVDPPVLTLVELEELLHPAIATTNTAATVMTENRFKAKPPLIVLSLSTRVWGDARVMNGASSKLAHSPRTPSIERDADICGGRRASNPSVYAPLSMSLCLLPARPQRVHRSGLGFGPLPLPSLVRADARDKGRGKRRRRAGQRRGSRGGRPRRRSVIPSIHNKVCRCSKR